MRCAPPDRGPAWRVAAAAACVLLLLGGCGNEKRDFREQKLSPLIEQLSRQRAELATILRSARPGNPDDAAFLRQQMTGLATTGRRIAALTPPAGTERKFRSYTRANAAFLASLSRFIDAFESNGRRRQRKRAKQTQRALARVEKTQRQLQSALK